MTLIVSQVLSYLVLANAPFFVSETRPKRSRNYSVSESQGAPSQAVKWLRTHESKKIQIFPNISIPIRIDDHFLLRKISRSNLFRRRDMMNVCKRWKKSFWCSNPFFFHVRVTGAVWPEGNTICSIFSQNNNKNLLNGIAKLPKNAKK